MLKVSLPSREFENELQALREFAGEGCVQLLEADLERGALLLERLSPGRPLAAFGDDDRAMASALSLMTRLWRKAPVTHCFWSVRRWCKSLLEHDLERDAARRGPLSVGHVERARALLEDLLGDSQGELLLHGDFHQYNVLDADGRGFVAIDPKGVVGDIGFELGPLFRNLLLDTEDPHRRLTLRAARTARELGCAEEWVLAWAFAHAVLSALWRIEDQASGLDDALRAVEVMADVLA